MRQVAFRLDSQMVGAVEERIERDGITLSSFMRQAVRDALRADPGLSLPALKIIALQNAEPEQVERFRSALESAFRKAVESLCGQLEAPAIAGAPKAQSDWVMDIPVRIYDSRSGS